MMGGDGDRREGLSMTMDHARDLGEPAVDSAAMNLGDEIQRARHRARLTQTDVADRLGVGAVQLAPARRC